jgi:DNA (cytosine-5)-methyltransferase 1
VTEYERILNEAWAAHMADRAADAPTVVSTFAGIGGSSLGYSMAGYKGLLALEWDGAMADIYRRNFDEPVLVADITKMDGGDVMAETGLSEGELDLLDGSPPCQGFSTTGRRRMDDVRNELTFDFIRILRGTRPKAFVMENVSGLVKGKMKLMFSEFMKALKASGYEVSCRLLDAK